MNKLFTKVASICLGLAMAVGVGVAVGSANKASRGFEAAGKSDWLSNEITSTSGLNTTDRYVFATSNTNSTSGSYFNGTVDSNPHWQVSAFGNNAPTSNSAAGVIQLESVSANVWKIKLVSTGKYVTATKAGTKGSSVSASSDSSGWYFYYTNNDGWNAVYQTAYSSKYACFRDYNNGSFRSYQATSSTAASGNGNSFKIYKYAAAAVKTLSSVAITTAATKTSFYAGETFDPSGLVLTATYSDSSTSTVTPASYKYGASGINPTSAGTSITTSTELNVNDHNGKTIYVLYTESTTTVYASYTITVEAARTITKVETGGDMETKSYYEGDDWDFTGLYLTVTWDKGTPNPTTVYLKDLTKDTDFECDPDDASNLETTEIYIYGQYGGFDFDFTIEDIEVSERPISDVLTIKSTSLNVPTGSGYQSFSGRNSSNASDITSSATYAGKAIVNNSTNLQINGDSGAIYTTASSSQYIKSVSVELSQSSTRTLTIYGSHTAYSGIITSDWGTTLLSFTEDGSKNVDVDNKGYFEYIYIRSSGAMYFKNITIIWGELVPTLSLSTTSFSFTEGDTGVLSTTATPSNFGGTVSYSFESSDSSVLSASNVSASSNTISFNKSNCSAGLTTITVTATYSTQSASASFNVECADPVRNLTSIAITTACSDISFEKGSIFTISNLVVTGTFDAAPLTSNVTNDCTFKLWNGESETALVPGTTVLSTAGNLTVRISHSENTHTPAQILTYGIEVFETQNFVLGSEGAAGYGNDVTNDFDVTLNSSTSLSSTINVYSINFFAATNGMQMNYSSKGDSFIYNTIAVPGEILRIELTWSNDYDLGRATPTIYFSTTYINSRPESGGIRAEGGNLTETIRPTGTSYYFFFDAKTTGGAIVLSSLKVVYRETSAGQAQNFADKFLHMNDYKVAAGYCYNSSEQHYYSTAQTAYGKLSDAQKTAFASNTDAVKRLQNWAEANKQSFDPNGGTFSASRINPLSNGIVENNMITIVVIMSVIGVATAGVFLFIKRKEHR